MDLEVYVFGTGDFNKGHQFAGVIAAPTQLGAGFIYDCLRSEVAIVGRGYLKKAGNGVLGDDANVGISLDTLIVVKNQLQQLGPIAVLKGVRTPGTKPVPYLDDPNLSSALQGLKIATTKLRPEIRIQRRS